MKRQRGFLLNPWRFAAAGGGGTDPNFASVVFLSHLDGSNGATTFVDVTARHTQSAVANAVLSTAQKKFGTASAAFDGTGDAISCAGNTGDFSFAAGDFTVECFFRLSATNRQGLLSIGPESDWATIDIATDGSSTRGIHVRCSNGSTWSVIIDSTAAVWTVDTWHHLAVTRSGSTFTIWVDGVSRGTATSSATLRSNTQPLLIGRSGWWSATANGFIDEVRVTKGVARYTGGFAAPTAPFPDS